MKVVQINAVYNGSTGKICRAVNSLLDKENIENYFFYTLDGEKENRLAGKFYIKLQALKSKIKGNYGFNSVRATKKLINKLEEIKPDIVNLHNIHGHNVNLKLLFSYLKENKIKTVWTFHDCFSFTAYCPHYDGINCDKWKSGCFDCPVRKEYSKIFDKSKKLYKLKKELFTGLDLTITAPSKWIAEQVKESFMKDYPVKVIYNGIDLKTFKQRESNFRKMFGLEDKFIVLGVSYIWNEKKGLDDFIELSKRVLPKDFQIVMVGLDDKTILKLPKNIIGIDKTENQERLAEIYSAADVLFNPTKEEALGLVNLEALACGTPVVTYRTGGSPETLNESCGIVVDKGDLEGAVNAMINIYNEKPFSGDDCIRQAEKFDQNKTFTGFCELYKEIGKN